MREESTAMRVRKILDSLFCFCSVTFLPQKKQVTRLSIVSLNNPSRSIITAYQVHHNKQQK